MKSFAFTSFGILTALFFISAGEARAQATPRTCSSTQAAIANAVSANHFDQVANGSVTVILRGTKKTVSLSQAIDSIKSSSVAIKNASLPQASCAEAVAVFDAMTRAARSAASVNEAKANAAFAQVEVPAAMKRRAANDQATKVYEDAVAPMLKVKTDAAQVSTNVERAIADGRAVPTISRP